ncbi:cytochrome P450 71A6-like [Salvia splendens]|uniref:cytochrome P450 71A6-like n=1 Tax=Salvia splendens TaxID=180675 RepID=UPI001C25A9B9|nr:cytochrome P450 71A6-like [Salvia splendens]
MKNQDLIFSNRPQLSIARPAVLQQPRYGVRTVWRTLAADPQHMRASSSEQQKGSVLPRREGGRNFPHGGEDQKVGCFFKPVNLSDVIQSLTIDVICRVALGKKYSLESDFKEIFGEFGELVGILPLWEYIPWLRWMRRFDGLDKRRENASRSPIEDDTIKAIVLDMFAAGTDTTYTTLEWAMTELIRNPETMKTLQNEVRVAGNKDEIDEQDLDKMPYLKAVIKESLRLHSPGPLLLPRELTQDTRVLGYEVASGTRVMINVWAISRDPSLWKNPEEFSSREIP